MLNKFEKFWADKADPLHRSTDALYLDKYSSELSILVENKVYNSVLDLGCGTGTFYERLKFDKATHFVGVDFSQKMLSVFEQNFPDAKLVCANAAEYLDDGRYDLIFSNSMLQNFDIEMLRQHLENAKKMLSPDGVIVIASIPWKRLKFSYLSGEASATPKKAHFVKGLIGAITRSAADNGRWYTCKEIATLADNLNLTTEFFGSMHYPYRMHVILHNRDD